MLQLNIEDIVSYDDDELQHIGNIIVNSAWDDQKEKTRQIKQKISQHSLRVQGCCCVYCERLLIGLNPQIDHIANKADYKEFSFEPLNLASACSFCNGPTNKHNKDTISIKNDVYSECIFKIVHPYLDRIEEHFAYLDNSKLVYDYSNCSNKGKITIDFFGWDSIQFVYISSQIIEQRKKPLPFEMEKLILEISTYKPRAHADL